VCGQVGGRERAKEGFLAFRHVVLSTVSISFVDNIIIFTHKTLSFFRSIEGGQANPSRLHLVPIS